LKACGSAAILCGGKSSRMGMDKSRIKINGKLLIQLIAEELNSVFDEIILIPDDLKKFSGFNYKVAEDLEKGCGPAGGIYTGLNAASSQYIFVTACDMPFVNTDYIRYMIDVIEKYNPDCVISRNGKWVEPLCAFYSKSLIDNFRQCISNKTYRLFEIIKDSNIYYVEEEKVRGFSSEMEMFININYLKDLDILKKIYGEEVDICE